MKYMTIRALQKGLSDGSWTSTDLVKYYIHRITKYDSAGPRINAIAEINPDVYQIAQLLDDERKISGPRSLLHGIPMVIKDNIFSKDRMHTTASSIALENYYADIDATIVKKLRDAGAIILGKANLSEFAYFMSFDDMPSGYGSRHGQVKSPYQKNIDPLGSSTGSAVAVACDFIPVAIGTETNGSLTAPALMNSVQTIKPSMGMVSRHGIIPISHHQDIAGPLAKTVEDLAIMMQSIVGYDQEDLSTHLIKDKEYNFLHALKQPINQTRIGFIKFKNVQYSDEELSIEEEAKILFKGLGADLIELEIEAESIANFETLIYDFKVDVNHFFSQFMSNYPIKSLKDLIEFNQQDPTRRLKYGQSIFEASEKTDGRLLEHLYHTKFQENLEKAHTIDRLLHANDLDCMVSIKRTSYAPIAGNPVVAVVAKVLTDDQPKSLFFIGKKMTDDRLLMIAHHYEINTLKRINPTLELLEKED